VLYRDLTSLYEGFANGSQSALGPPSIQYADYAVAAALVDSGAADSQLDY
jgi:hypothetical protein